MTENEKKKYTQNTAGRAERFAAEDVTVKLAAFLDELADMFGEGAGMLSRVADSLYENDNPRGTEHPDASEGEPEDAVGDLAATVLYAVPGLPAQLMTEEDALSQFPGFAEEQTFHRFAIRAHLYLHYMAYAWESETEITITAPVFVARSNDRETENTELTARDFMAAIAFLHDHLVTLADETGKTGCGYWLPKEED